MDIIHATTSWKIILTLAEFYFYHVYTFFLYWDSSWYSFLIPIAIGILRSDSRFEAFLNLCTLIKKLSLFCYPWLICLFFLFINYILKPATNKFNKAGVALAYSCSKKWNNGINKCKRAFEKTKKVMEAKEVVEKMDKDGELNEVGKTKQG